MIRLAAIEDILSAYTMQPRGEDEIANDAVRIRTAMRRRTPVARLTEVSNVLPGYRLRASLNGANECEIFGEGAELVLTLNR